MIHPLKTFSRLTPKMWNSTSLSRRLLAIALCVAVAIGLSPLQLAHAAPSVTVNDNADGITANCTLRAAVQAVNTSSSVGGCSADVTTNTILFQAGLGPITLTTGELLITKSMTIQGPGANVLSVSGNAFSRIFDIDAGQTVTISGLTITNGNSTGSAGGAILSHGTLTLSKVTVSNSVTDREGGGIENDGALFILQSTISGNSTTGANDSDGGGVRSTGPNAQAIIVNSTISGNTANLANVSADGGGLRNSLGTMTLASTTVYGNKAGGNGGNIHRGSGTVNLKNTLVAGGSVGSGAFGPDIWGSVHSQGYDLIQSISGASILDDTTTNLIGTAPNLSPLQNNGGPTSTHAELVTPSASISIDAGDPAGCKDQNGTVLTTDQRGNPRPLGTRCDIGAYEMIRPDTVGIYNTANGEFYLSKNNASILSHFVWGPGNPWAAISGDWDGNGIDTIGIYNTTDGEFYLTNNNSAIASHFTWGPGGTWTPIVGDWDGNGADTIGIYNTTNGEFYLTNNNVAIASHFFWGPGNPWAAISGDWDGNGTTTIGIYNTTNGEFYLTNNNVAIASHFFWGIGNPWAAISGDWDGNGTSTIGIYNTTNGEFYLTNNNVAIASHFFWGVGGTWKAIVGRWGAGSGGIPAQLPNIPTVPTVAPAPTFVPKK